MAIELNRIVSTPMAQTLTIRSHALVVDGTAAEGGDDTGPTRTTCTTRRWARARRSRCSGTRAARAFP